MEWTNEQRRMLFRFSLYGFLKNQRYFETFLILAYLGKGLSFFQIGLLAGFTGFCTNVFEVPSGAVADLYGRRKSMIFSSSAYTLSFVVLALSTSLWQLFLAMFFFSLGEAFRTGTHKAMIFDWLASIGKEKERVRVYGYTRSWSKMGSALSALLAAGLVFVLRDFDAVFWLSVPPCLLNIVNFLGYPDVVEGDPQARRPAASVKGHILGAAREAWRHRGQRRLLLESAGFEGVFEVCKDYLQPVLQQAALALPVLLVLAGDQRTALLVGAVYVVLFLLSSYASQHAHTLVRWQNGDEDRAARLLWRIYLGVYVILVPGLYFEWHGVVIVAFIVAYLVQNLWRPALVSRLDACSDAATGATTLSIESQVRSIFAMVAAPALGWAVDHVGLWPVGALGAVAALAALVLGRSPDGMSDSKARK